MGRQQYLTRLALGRSAFEDPDTTQIPGGDLNPQNAQIERDHSHFPRQDYEQLYDSKGRPLNPAIERFNAGMRTAQNDVLALVGVVERKDQNYLADERRRYAARLSRKALLCEEHDTGETLDWATSLARFIARLWTESFIQRIQVGLYDPRLSMSEILLQEWRSLRTGNVRLTLAMLFPSLGNATVNMLVKFPLIFAVEQITGRLQALIQKRRLSRVALKRMDLAFTFAIEVILLAIDAALLPMDYYATAQRLGLAPALPLFPPLQSFWPWNHSSFHQFGWKLLTGPNLLSSLTSPAALLLLARLLIVGSDEDEDAPVLRLLTPFRYQAINDSTIPPIPSPRLTIDPVGWVAYQTMKIRHRFLQYCNWNLMKRNVTPRHDDYENNMLPLQPDQTEFSTWRSTDLTHLVPRALNEMIKSLFHRILTLPFDSLMLRSVAITYVTSAFTPKTSAAVSAASHLYMPFGGGPISQVIHAPTSATAWNAAGSYFNRMGLALALHTSVNTILFFGTYGLTRYVGRTHYDWKGMDGKAPGEESFLR
ncbi:Hypothetical predicted protein [Lecanosticta acicola]|uniref:Uncharacterized protein n=1 Tax=Lecanosticta acicola TaxID=111012 RepID=A0AAI8YZ02_9PEZI|nr:Hypothetical predicted protein [Lecanosticta acicola]